MISTDLAGRDAVMADSEQLLPEALICDTA